MSDGPFLPDITTLTDGQVRELAEAYLDLLGKMTTALEECDTGYGFFSWSGFGFNITGHPPHDLVDVILGTTP